MYPKPEEMSSHELQVLFHAALGRGEKAGRVKMISSTRLEIGNMGIAFGSGSIRSDCFGEATRNLIKYGYLNSFEEGTHYECMISPAGYEVAEACCHEWWKREFDIARRRR